MIPQFCCNDFKLYMCPCQDDGSDWESKGEEEDREEPHPKYFGLYPFC